MRPQAGDALLVLPFLLAFSSCTRPQGLGLPEDEASILVSTVSTVSTILRTRLLPSTARAGAGFADSVAQQQGPLPA
ncbi:hypothetical protein KDI_56250 [Dictyobacter arantiisoli]|uniref:Uncharacterized protein n=1 Tax=Dictyobacter arantiisoli TaxID=2014874 RepID=A0A5A5TK98_9CHLR|nr:hypothetical protein KDI_56250 [Dictyobacter arantiisoli]